MEKTYLLCFTGVILLSVGLIIQSAPAQTLGALLRGFELTKLFVAVGLLSLVFGVRVHILNGVVA